jgi:hypothetical protein
MAVRTILMLAVISMCGCTTMRTVAPPDLQAVLDRLQPGDRVAVRTADGWHEDLTVASVTDSDIQAENPDGERVTFARQEVGDIRVRVRAPGRTVALVLGILWFFPGIPGLSLCTAHGGC